MSNPNVEHQSQKRRPSPQQVVGVLIAIVAIVFIVENSRKTRIRFIAPEVTTWLWLALLVAAALGFLAGVLVTRHRRQP